MKGRKSEGNRRWCKICNVWIADNKAQREQHEQAKKHRDALKALLAEIARKNKKASDVAPCAFGGVGQQSGSGNGRAVAQLLSAVARGTSESNIQSFCETPQDTKRGKEIGVPDSSARRVELLDANGFPLPVGEVYGEWRAAADNHDDREGSDSSFVDEIAKRYNTVELETEGSVNNVGHSCPKRKLQDEDDSNDTENNGSAASAARDNSKERDIASAFRRRIAPRTRRVRRKLAPR